METVKLQVVYQLSASVHREMVLAGNHISRSHTVDVEMPAREAIEQGFACVESNGTYRVYCPVELRLALGRYADWVDVDHVLVAGEVDAMLRAEIARHAEEAERDRNRQIQRDAENDALAERGRVTVEVKRADDEAYAAQRDEWIRAHGSDRLRKILDLGYIDESRSVYRDERLALDYPGWIVDCDATAEESEIRNPSLEALEALEEARRISPDAQLVKVRAAFGDGSDYEGAQPWREAIRLDDLPGIRSSKVFYRLV